MIQSLLYQERAFVFMVEAKKLYIKKLKDMYKRKEGRDISDEEAMEIFESLIMLVRSVYKPIKKHEREI